MGTEYIIHNDNNTEFAIAEISNRLTFTAFNKNSSDIIISDDFTPEELINKVMDIIKVASYWVDDPDIMIEQLHKRLDYLYDD